MRHNILLCIDSFFDGGAEMFVVYLGNSLIKNHNVHILEVNKFKSKNKKLMDRVDGNICIFQPDNILALKLLRYMKSRIPLPFFTRFSELSISLLKYFFVWLYIVKNRINVVHSNSWISDYFMSKVIRFSNARFIITLHGHYELTENSTENFLPNTAKIVSTADHIAYLTNKNLRPFEGIEFDRGKLHLICNGIPKNHNDQSKRKEDQIHFAIASRAIKEKGWEEAINAVNELIDKTGYPIFLHLFGGGDIVDALKKKYSKNKNIIFYGFVLNVIDNLKDMDVCLLPSYYHAESMPFSIIEYLSLGKPVIASRIGYIEEMIQTKNGLAGFLIELNNDGINEDQLKKSMFAYIENPDLVKEHSELAEKAFEKFDIKYCENKYLNLYSR